MFKKMKLIPAVDKPLSASGEESKSDIIKDITSDINATLLKKFRSKSKHRTTTDIAHNLALLRRIKERNADKRVQNDPRREILKGISPITKGTERLLDLLRNAGVTMNERGELSIKGRALAGSNYEDVIHYLVRNRIREPPPKGFDDIAPYMRNLNIPRSLVTNLKARRQIYNNQVGRGRMIYTDWSRWV